ncbi:hypothetical protein J3R30DRAFT_3724871 [Lentinula aciculospora]|uniref:Choline/carnitine acyltransferase domain-containing protein n=1 Tax=Lentinula aciculospora TaxID=153920 RepID=A0A9W8ZS75_9AGAR|nr:hypothetical protein J3R30DRAFT_3724871 [Lentinula aciculospora]
MPKVSQSFKYSALSYLSEFVPQGYILNSNAPPMLRSQGSLPQLPVTSLFSSASKYLEGVSPHVNDAAFAETEAAVKEYVVSPHSAELQRRLEARAAEPEIKSRIGSVTSGMTLPTRAIGTLQSSFREVTEGYPVKPSDVARKHDPEDEDDYVRWTITSFKRSTAELKHYIVEAATRDAYPGG